MSLATLVRDMAAAGAPPEAIALALEAIEARDTVIDQRRAADRERKRRQRERDMAVTVTGQSRDSHGNVTSQTPAPAPSPSFPPDPQTNPAPTHTPASTTRARKGSRLPDNFSVPEDWLEWAMAERGWTRSEAESEGDAFCDHWRAKPGANATKLDWQATWRNWIRNSRRGGRNGQRNFHDRESGWAARPGMAGKEPVSLDD